MREDGCSGLQTGEEEEMNTAAAKGYGGERDGKGEGRKKGCSLGG